MLQYHVDCQAALVDGRSLIATRLGARGARPPARGRSRLLFFVGLDRDRAWTIGADRRREHVERKAVIAPAVHSRGGARVLTVAVVIGVALIAEASTVVVAAAVRAIVAVAAIASFVALVGLALGLGALELFTVLVIVTVVALARTLILEAGAIFAEHAEIVIGVLQIIFGLDPVAGKLRVARQALVLLEQLGGVPALAIVLAVPRLSAKVPSPLSTAAATAAALSLIDQTLKSLL